VIAVRPVKLSDTPALRIVADSAALVAPATAAAALPHPENSVSDFAKSGKVLVIGKTGSAFR
jgi:hypothetical protein